MRKGILNSIKQSIVIVLGENKQIVGGCCSGYEEQLNKSKNLVDYIIL